MNWGNGCEWLELVSILEKEELYQIFKMNGKRGSNFMRRRLVAYFSASGVTEKAAKQLAEAVQADIYEIRPKVPYTDADLDWQDKNSRSSVEMNNRNSRPALMDCDADIAGYDVIFLGFPIWWYVAPTIINTFLESYNFSGKTIVPFATSGGSGMGRTNERLAPSCPGADLVKGKMLNGFLSQAELKAWAEKL